MGVGLSEQHAPSFWWAEQLRLLFSSGVPACGKTPCLNLARDRVDGGTSSDYSFEDLKNRSGYHQKHASYPLDVIEPLSFQRSFLSGSAQTCSALIIFVLPRHGKNNGGKGELCPKSENKSKSSQKYSQINSYTSGNVSNV